MRPLDASQSPTTLRRAESGGAGLLEPCSPRDHRRDSSASKRSLSALNYAEAVKHHAAQDIEKSQYPGYTYETLADYLNYFINSNKKGALPTSLVTHYTVSSDGSQRTAVNWEDVQKFCNAIEQRSRSAAHIVFIRGLPSSEWLAAIGAAFKTDPEFFQRHIEFRSTFSQWDYFPFPTLPSAANNFVRLRYITTGQWNRESTRAAASMEEIDQKRDQSARAMNQYLHAVRLGMVKDDEVGNSIVRAFSIYDEVHFAIEQEISVHVTRKSKGWAAVVWSDTGNDLTHGTAGPWRGLGSDMSNPWTIRNFNATIQPLSNGALRSHKTALPKDLRRRDKTVQSSALLHLEYGKLLEQDVLACDAFYAMNPIFTFVANSESAFLNMIESKLAADSSFTVMSQRSLELSNLLYIQKALEAHSGRLEESLESIKARGGTDWPHASAESLHTKAETAANILQRDFEALIHRAERLLAICQSGMNHLRNEAQIATSQRSSAQASEVAKLTRLAFIYVPLSFVASFFGMNLSPLVAAPYSVWVYFAVSAVVLVCSLIFMFANLERWGGRLENHLRRNRSTQT